MNIGLANFESSSVITEIVVGVKISYSGIRELTYAIHFHTARMVSYTIVWVHNTCMLLSLKFVRSAKHEINEIESCTKFYNYSACITFVFIQY